MAPLKVLKTLISEISFIFCLVFGNEFRCSWSPFCRREPVLAKSRLWSSVDLATAVISHLFDFRTCFSEFGVLFCLSVDFFFWKQLVRVNSRFTPKMRRSIIKVEKVLLLIPRKYLSVLHMPTLYTDGFFPLWVHGRNQVSGCFSWECTALYVMRIHWGNEGCEVGVDLKFLIGPLYNS